ncbi:MAG: FtsX-like permease family protein [Candidatus Heimdallarchaeota archaeon]
MSNESDLNSATKYSFKSVFRIFIKTGKKRLVLTTLTGVILFLVLSSFFMAWYSYRYTSFYQYIDTYHDWQKDGTTSYFSSEFVDHSFNLSNNYLDRQVTTNISRLNSIMPNVYNNHTAALSTILYHYVSEPQAAVYDHFLVTFDDLAYTVLSNSLVEGRLPTNASEIVVYRQSTNFTITLNDVIGLRGVNNNIFAYNQNLTVVGIVEDVEDQLYAAGFSYNILRRATSSTINDLELILFTSTDFYFDIINTYSSYRGYFTFCIDFVYQFDVHHIRKTTEYLQAFYTPDPYGQFDYHFCSDLRNALDGFEFKWFMDTINVFICSLPLIMLFGIVCAETFKIGTHDLESKFRLMKIQGMEYKTIKRMLLLENLIFSSIGILIGSIAGFFVGYFIFLGFGYNSIADYFFSLLEPIIPISLILLYLLFFVGGYFIENSLAKKTAKLTTTRYTGKRKGRFRRFLRAQEIVMLIPGFSLAGIGFVGILLLNLVDYNLFMFSIEKLYLGFAFIIAIGGLFLLTSIFLLLARVVMILWSFIGRKIWSSTKSFATLSLKHLSIYSNNYQRAIIVVFIISLGITPGLVSSRSVNDHIAIEADFRAGFSDLVIGNWDAYYRNIRSNITEIEGIENLAEITMYTVSNYYMTDYNDPNNFLGTLLSITNITNFLDVVDDELFELTSYTKEDIIALEVNNTSLVSKYYVKELTMLNETTFKPIFINPSLIRSVNLTMVGQFEYFPFLQHIKRVIYNPWYTTGQFITSQDTWNNLKNYTGFSVFDYSLSHLLIKTTPEANLTFIKQELYQKFDLEAYTAADLEESMLANVSSFSVSFLIIAAVLTVLTSLFFGFITARNIYHQRLRIIESQYQIGAKRQQIWFSYTIELWFVILVPITVGMLVVLPALKYALPFVLNLQTVFYDFKPWLPWWMVLLIIVIGYVAITVGWLVKLLPLVKKYRPIKQE